MSAKLSNQIKRSFNDAGHTLSAFGNVLKSGIKSTSKKIGFGEAKWINKTRKLQKKKFKELHQQTYLEQGKDEEKKVAVDSLKALAEALSASSSSSIASSTPLPQLDASRVEKYNDKSKVNRTLFVKKVSDYIIDCLNKWETATAKQRKSLVFIRSGKAIHIFSMPFFNDTLHDDDSETISWNDFKTNVFYTYLKNMEENIKKIKSEIKAISNIKQAFSELVSELKEIKASPAAPKTPRKAKKEVDVVSNESTVSVETAETAAVPVSTVSIVSTVSSETSWPIPATPLVTANCTKNVTYKLLYDRLSIFKTFNVGDDFWNLPCWNEANFANEVTEEDFLATWVNHKTIESLEATLVELEEEQRISVGENTLLLTSSPSSSRAAPVDDENKDDFDDEEDDSVNDATSKSQGNRETDSNSVVLATPPGASAASESKQKFFEDVRTIAGIPKEILKIYPNATRITRVILRKLVLVIKKKKSLDSTMCSKDVAKELLQNSIILFSNARVQQNLEIEQEKQRYLQLVKKNKKKQSVLDTISTEYKVVEEALLSAQSDLKNEYDNLTTLFRKNYRKQYKRLVNKNNAESIAVVSQEFPLQTEASFKTQVDSIPSLASASAVGAAGAVPASVDYTSEFHEALKHIANSLNAGTVSSAVDYGFLYATKVIKEWQEFNNVGLVERLSLDFLKTVIADYCPDGDCGLSDVLDILKKFGVATEEAFNNFSNRRDKDSKKAHAQLLTHSAQYSIDEFFKVKAVDELKAALYKYGPALLTLPVFNKLAEKFWEAKDDDAKILGYHTVVASGYNDEKGVFTIRNSLGKEYGKLGNSEIPYDDAFKNSLATVVLDGGNRRIPVSNTPVKEVDPLTAKIVDSLALLSNA